MKSVHVLVSRILEVGGRVLEMEGVHSGTSQGAETVVRS